MDRDALRGRWATRGADGLVELLLHSSQRYSLVVDENTWCVGTWALDDGRLDVAADATIGHEPTVAALAVEEGTLHVRLSGAEGRAKAWTLHRSPLAAGTESATELEGNWYGTALNHAYRAGADALDAALDAGTRESLRSWPALRELRLALDDHGRYVLFGRRDRIESVGRWTATPELTLSMDDWLVPDGDMNEPPIHIRRIGDDLGVAWAVHPDGHLFEAADLMEVVFSRRAPSWRP